MTWGFVLPIVHDQPAQADRWASRSAGMDGTGRLTVRTARDGDRVLVEIGDNGPGIPEPVAAHILEPLPHHQAGRQGHRPGSTSAGGIVVKRYHGDLQFTPPRATPASGCRSPGAGDPRAQTGSRRSPPWAAMAQMTRMSRVMISSDQNG